MQCLHAARAAICFYECHVRFSTMASKPGPYQYSRLPMKNIRPACVRKQLNLHQTGRKYPVVSAPDHAALPLACPRGATTDGRRSVRGQWWWWWCSSAPRGALSLGSLGLVPFRAATRCACFSPRDAPDGWQCCIIARAARLTDWLAGWLADWARHYCLHRRLHPRYSSWQPMLWLRCERAHKRGSVVRVRCASQLPVKGPHRLAWAQSMPLDAEELQPIHHGGA